MCRLWGRCCLCLFFLIASCGAGEGALGVERPVAVGPVRLGKAPEVVFRVEASVEEGHRHVVLKPWHEEALLGAHVVGESHGRRAEASEVVLVLPVREDRPGAAAARVLLRNVPVK